MCVPDEYSGKGVCISGHCWDNKKEKVFYLIGRKIGFLFVLFCFKHDKRLSGFHSVSRLPGPGWMKMIKW